MGQKYFFFGRKGTFRGEEVEQRHVLAAEKCVSDINFAPSGRRICALSDSFPDDPLPGAARTHTNDKTANEPSAGTLGIHVNEFKMSCTQVAIRVIGPQVQLVALFEFEEESVDAVNKIEKWSN